METIRISLLSNVHNSGPRTQYTTHVYSDEHHAYIYAGVGFAPGMNRSEDECRADFRRQVEPE